MIDQPTTATQMHPLLGAVADYPTANGLNFRVHITEVKTAYGRTRVQITPEQGTGTAWVELTSIQIDTDAQVGQPIRRNGPVV